MLPAREKKILSAKHIALIFANLEEITSLSQVYLSGILSPLTSQEFLNALEDLRRQDPIVDDIGHLFLRMVRTVSS